MQGYPHVTVFPGGVHDARCPGESMEETRRRECALRVMLVKLWEVSGAYSPSRFKSWSRVHLGFERRVAPPSCEKERLKKLRSMRHTHATTARGSVS